MRYSLLISRVEPHPKAGEKLPDGNFNSGVVYPDTICTQVLSVELDDAEFKAVKKACVEAAN